jgi:hypothetical protein
MVDMRRTDRTYLFITWRDDILTVALAEMANMLGTSGRIFILATVCKEFLEWQ